MSAQRKRILDRPVFLLVLAAFLTALLVQSGQLGSIDTMIRLQTTHSYWTSKPSVPDSVSAPTGRYSYMGAVGKNGRVYGAYGMGQSLLLLPSDIVGTAMAHLRVFHFDIRSIVTSYSTNILVCVLTILVSFRWLHQLEFTINQSLAGTLGLLFGTTFLHYTQNMMENNLMFLLMLTGLSFQYEWLRTGHAKSLLMGCLALGGNLLVRLTTAMDIAAVALFVLLILLWKREVHGQEIRARLGKYVCIAAPCYGAFVAIDRAYQYHRFGSIFNTYLSVLAAQQKKADPTLPPNYPWSGPFHEGLLGPFFSPAKSIFLFDPLIIITLLLCLLLWNKFRPDIRALLVAGLSLLATYVLFYAKYYDWSGDFAWGDRFITTPVQLLAMISIPLLLRHRSHAPKTVWRLGIVIVSVGVIIQLASVAFWHPLEINQMRLLPSHRTFVIGLRFENIAAVTLNRVNEWGLSNEATRDLDGIQADTPYFLPFLCRKDGSVSERTANVLLVAWWIALAVLIVVLWLIRHEAVRGDFVAAAAG